jgi:xanthine dehydrogenase accessory factor
MEPGKLIVVRGGGDIATGTICRLHNCGFRLLVLETEHPNAIRRAVSLSEAVYDSSHTVEGVTALRVNRTEQCEAIWQQHDIPILVDPEARCLQKLRPFAVVDAILAKKNIGTNKDMAAVTIALGPGFSAGEDVDAVIETARGHDLGRVILSGPALPNTGIPGAVAGFTTERVLYAQQDGRLEIITDIGSSVTAGELLARIDDEPVTAPFQGLVRGMIRHGSLVKKGLKIADIDPRCSEQKNCYTISDKARCISGGVLEALLFLHLRNN